MGISPEYSGSFQEKQSLVQDDAPLTPREREVLSYLASGASNKEIAETLGVKVVTIKLHVRGICRKLHVKNRTQAALKAGRVGVFPMEASH